MSSIYLKISSLFIRTLSKPIANQIKQQAREHEGFRKICISFAQTMHRLDMRLRLGLLQDQAAIDRQIAREAAEAKAKKAQSSIPTVKTEAQAKADETAAAHEKTDKHEKDRKRPQPKIRPLSEAKAIDSGANFISESFLFSVGLGLIIFETWRSRRKENTRRSDVADQIATLESQNRSLSEELHHLSEEVSELRAKGQSPSLWQKLHLSSQAGTETSSPKAVVGPLPTEQAVPVAEQSENTSGSETPEAST